MKTIAAAIASAALTLVTSGSLAPAAAPDPAPAASAAASNDWFTCETPPCENPMAPLLAALTAEINRLQTVVVARQSQVWKKDARIARLRDRIERLRDAQ